VKSHDPAPTDGPAFTCEVDGVVWTCPKLYTIDILAHDDCDSPGSHPDWKCVDNGKAKMDRISFTCGTVSGSCPITTREYGVDSDHDKKKEVPCS